jgi:hypothetical protein
MKRHMTSFGFALVAALAALSPAAAQDYPTRTMHHPHHLAGSGGRLE